MLRIYSNEEKRLQNTAKRLGKYEALKYENKNGKLINK